jgi:hypothetical protein
MAVPEGQGFVKLETIGEGPAAAVEVWEKGGVGHAAKKFSRPLKAMAVCGGGDVNQLLTVHHAHLVRVDNVVAPSGLSKGVVLLMELCSGGSLKTRISQSLLRSATSINEMIGDIAAALCSLHEAGIVHGGLKPSNILFSDSVVKFGDLISVRAFDLGVIDCEVKKTAYSAPELYGDSKPTMASDIWAVGVIVYQILTGELPVDPELCEGERLSKMQSWERPSLPENAAPVLREVLASCWAADPKERMAMETICAEFERAQWRLVQGAEPRRVTARGQVGHRARCGDKLHLDPRPKPVAAGAPGELARSSPDRGVRGAAHAVAGRQVSFSVFVNGEVAARAVTIQMTGDSSGRDILRGLGEGEAHSLWMGPRDVSDARAVDIWQDMQNGGECEAGTKVSRLVSLDDRVVKRIVTEALVLEVDFLEAISKAFDQEMVVVELSTRATEVGTDAAPDRLGQVNLRVVARRWVLPATAGRAVEPAVKRVEAAEGPAVEEPAVEEPAVEELAVEEPAVEAVEPVAFALSPLRAAEQIGPMRQELVGATACRTEGEMEAALAEIFQRVGIVPLLPSEMRAATRVGGRPPPEDWLRLVADVANLNEGVRMMECAWERAILVLRPWYAVEEVGPIVQQYVDERVRRAGGFVRTWMWVPSSGDG